jgi:septum formation protein
MTKIILASGSPRRRELLSGLGIEFEIKASSIPEERHPDESPRQYVERLAIEKASFVAKNVDSAIVIGADTVVVIEDLLLEKPRDRDDARQMLQRLSGQWHEVLTGLCLIQTDTGKIVSDVESTKVLFHPLTDEDVEWYLDTGEPFDKAGSYAIQGHGSLIVDKVEGNYFNVVGLPTNLLRRLAHQLGLEVRNW